MTRTRSLTVLACVSLVLAVSACGTEDADDPASGGSNPSSTTTAPSSTVEVQPIRAIGRLLLNQRLAVSPAEYPLPDVPTQATVASAAELGKVFFAVPGIDAIVAELGTTPLQADERLFAYTVNACTTEELALQLDGSDVRLVVSGTSTLRCEPPTTLVVWAVGDEAPADAQAVQAVQK